MEQKVMIADEHYKCLSDYFTHNGIKRILLVCSSSFSLLRIKAYFEKAEKTVGVKVVYFSDFQPNPQYDSVVKGIRIFHQQKCDAIIAIGGGSAIDVAKCIKLYLNMDDSRCYLQQSIVPNDVKLLAMPTTAGTGSEATKYAVIYYNDVKQSVSDQSCIPSAVLLDVSALKTLPVYQRKSTMMDAFCHAIESFWSVNSTKESIEYSTQAIQMILSNQDGYLANDEAGNAAMLKAANLAGKAINITQTTAGHAMCYKLISLYKISHGHAVALCVRKLWPYMINNINLCIDTRGVKYLNSIFDKIAYVMNCKEAMEAACKFQMIFEKLHFVIPKCEKKDFEILKNSVNLLRLKNNPIRLDIDVIDILYHQILEEVK